MLAVENQRVRCVELDKATKQLKRTPPRRSAAVRSVRLAFSWRRLCLRLIVSLNTAQQMQVVSHFDLMYDEYMDWLKKQLPSSAMTKTESDAENRKKAAYEVPMVRPWGVGDSLPASKSTRSFPMRVEDCPHRPESLEHKGSGGTSEKSRWWMCRD